MSNPAADIRIGVDFDGTIVKHNFPDIGDPVPGAIEWLQHFNSLGVDIFLWTARGDNRDQGKFTDAINYLMGHDLGFVSTAARPDLSYSRKSHAHMYIDDAAIGCPLAVDPGESKPYVDWEIVGPMVMRMIGARCDGENHRLLYAKLTAK